MKSDIGLIGLAVMGENLALNMESKGFTVSVYNRTVSKVDKLINGRGKGKNFIPCHTLNDLVLSIKKPRKIMLMVKAGKPVDLLLEALIPLLNQDDIIIDGGNSEYHDTDRRIKLCSDKRIHFVGTGISGGEEGALTGPSLMVGGVPEAWPSIKKIFQSIAAKVEGSVACCDWIGTGGSGHFVKMVHNGIEYGDMQLICEAFHIMKTLLKLSAPEIHSIFAEWNKGSLNSYLIEITSEILDYLDCDGNPIIDKILDAAGQKGTGKWTGQTALDIGTPLNLIVESVFARCLSAMKDERVRASKILHGPRIAFSGDKNVFINNVKDALYASKIISYAQGFQLMKMGAKEFGWKLNYGNIALIWRGGCIIRSTFLKDISEAFNKNSELTNLMLAPYFSKQLIILQEKLRHVVATAVTNGIPTPAMSSAIAYFDGYRCERLPTNLLQAQRDYFGAHTYERIDKPRGEFFHTNWTNMT
jgi:6-phosphogluconate dehydrogenase